jgi:hypothetical protein
VHRVEFRARVVCRAHPSGRAAIGFCRQGGTQTIPIVFSAAFDGLGLVASLNRPGGNVTGMSTLALEVVVKQKARRGELIRTVAIGYLKTDDDRIEKDPDRRVQDTIALVFHKFEELQSVRQVLVWMRREQILLPAVVHSYGRQSIEWKAPSANSSEPWRRLAQWTLAWLE